MTWKHEIKESILRYAFHNGRWIQHGHLSAKMVYEHAHGCQPDVNKSSFTGDRVASGDVDSIEGAVRAVITCTCKALVDEVFTVVVDPVDLLAVILN